MPLNIGSQLGSHEITALLGKGGMGEVYRARDLKLKREVAIKILPEEFSSDADRVSRFQREAEVLASLNHPNIAGIYDFAEANGTRFLVLELVEGETLADRIARGPIPVGEALNIAIQICEALEAAHDRGIIHRDLKPANVKLTPEGNVKVLDFGLAKAMENTSVNPSLSHSPTLVTGSIAGMIIGTAAYMSPEQARGKTADQRSDVFAFGCVLYEMATGRQAFPGEDVSDVLASVMKVEADFSHLPQNLNPRFAELMRRCLAKNPKDRWYAVGDIRVEINSIISEPQRFSGKPPFWKRAIPAAITGILMAAISGSLVWRMRTPLPAAVIRFSYTLPKDLALTRRGRHILALSPDGEYMAFIGNQQLYLKSMSELEAKPIPGTMQDINTPFFSPDGKWIAFYVVPERTLKKIAITGGATVTIAEIDNPFGATWYSEDSIMVGQGAKGIIRVPAGGGKPQTVIEAKTNEVLHGPQVLPGGDELLFTVAGLTGDDRWDKAQIVVQSLKTGERKTLVTGGSDARYVPTGHIVYALGGNLFAVAFDAKKLQVTSGPIPIIESVMHSIPGNTAATFFSFSDNGYLAYVPGSSPAESNTGVLTLVDRAGTKRPLPLMPGRYSIPRISPDGKHVAVQVEDSKEVFVAIYDLSGSSSMRRLTFGGKNTNPLWTRDGQRIIFQSDRDGDAGLFWQRADGNGSPEKLITAAKGEEYLPESASPDGKVITVSESGGISTLALDGEHKLKVLIPKQPGKGVVNRSSFSPDGQWLAYFSSETGNIYVQPFPPTGAKYQITTGLNNIRPLWSPDGKQIFYIRGFESQDNRRLMAVDVQTKPTFVIGNTKPVPIENFLISGGQERPFDISPDGKQFIAIFAPDQLQSRDSASPQINTVLNWFGELKQRVPLH